MKDDAGIKNKCWDKGECWDRENKCWHLKNCLSQRHGEHRGLERQRSDVGGQDCEDGGLRSEIGDRRSEGTGQKIEGN